MFTFFHLVCICVHICATVCIWESEDDFVKPNPSSKDWIAKCGGKLLYPLNHHLIALECFFVCVCFVLRQKSLPQAGLELLPSWKALELLPLLPSLLSSLPGCSVATHCQTWMIFLFSPPFKFVMIHFYSKLYLLISLLLINFILPWKLLVTVTLLGWNMVAKATRVGKGLFHLITYKSFTRGSQHEN